MAASRKKEGASVHCLRYRHVRRLLRQVCGGTCPECKEPALPRLVLPLARGILRRAGRPGA